MTLVYCPRVVFFCTIFRTDIINKIGYLDENFEMGNFEDDDYCIRALSHKLKIAFDTSVFIHHFGSTSWKANNIDYAKYYKQNEKYFFNKYSHLLKKEG
jgi:GT2 family glycosyltransferase